MRLDGLAESLVAANDMICPAQLISRLLRGSLLSEGLQPRQRRSQGAQTRIGLEVTNDLVRSSGACFDDHSCRQDRRA